MAGFENWRRVQVHFHMFDTFVVYSVATNFSAIFILSVFTRTVLRRNCNGFGVASIGKQRFFFYGIITTNWLIQSGVKDIHTYWRIKIHQTQNYPNNLLTSTHMNLPTFSITSDSPSPAKPFSIQNSLISLSSTGLMEIYV